MTDASTPIIICDCTPRATLSAIANLNIVIANFPRTIVHSKVAAVIGVAGEVEEAGVRADCCIAGIAEQKKGK